jgi:hypothetical protein
MILVLEGLNGVGKSHRAKLLSQMLGTPIIRPFRRSMDQHMGREDGGMQARLRSLGIPANTYVEDVFVADLLVQTGASAILDRSVVSGIAYGCLYGTMPGVSGTDRDDVGMEVLRFWLEVVKGYKAGPLLYVAMTADRPVREARTVGRWRPNEREERQLARWYDLAWRALIDIPRMALDTTSGDDDADVQKIARVVAAMT